MLRCARYALTALCVAALIGCRTSETKNTNDIGLAENVPTGTLKSDYGDGRGDSVGTGGAALPLELRKDSEQGGEHEGH
jgi:hypothetical protein